MKLPRHTLLFILLVFAGCGGGSTQSVHQVNGVTINVRHAGDHVKDTATTKSADGIVTWVTEEMTYGLDHGHVMLNGKDYGEVKSGDTVVIQAGKVSVNGEERIAR
jgi:hypothetical protein